METSAESYPSGYTDDATTRVAPERLEKRELETRSRRYVLELQEVMTQATALPTPVNVTETLFEYDITGPRVRSVGQATGGYFKEVAENEAAFSHSLQDEVSLYIMHKIATNATPVHIKDIESFVGLGKVWMRIALLMKGGLLDLVGSELRITERGIRELEVIISFCDLHRK